MVMPWWPSAWIMRVTSSPARDSTSGSGTSTVASPTTASSAAARNSDSTFSWSSSSIRSVMFWRSSSSVSKPAESEAKSSSRSGRCLCLTSLTVIANSASLPATCLAPYSSGNVAVTARSSPATAPTRPSSKPGMRLPEPSSTSWSRPSPPGKGSPSTVPSKSIVRKSPISAGRSTACRCAKRSRRFSISSSTSSDATAGSRFPTSRPRYVPRSAVGRTPTSKENVSGLPSPGRSPRSTCGSPTGAMPESSIAFMYQPVNWSRTASSRIGSRPRRWMTIVGGIFP